MIAGSIKSLSGKKLSEAEVRAEKQVNRIRSVKMKPFKMVIYSEEAGPK